MIRLDRVGVQYAGVPVVRDVTLDVARGQWVALVGPNGAGKTTLLRALAHLLRHEGRIEVAGVPTSGLSRRRLARLVAYVPQQPLFPADMAVLDYVLLGRTPHIGYLRTETSRDRRVCEELLARLDLAGMRERRVGTLSGGERQRLVLARALAQEAPVLLLDEPTSALDLGRRVDALEIVDDLRCERQLTVVSAIHDLTLAGQFADRLALLDHGRLVADGAPRAVLRPDVLGPLFGIGVEVVEHDGELVVLSRRPPSWAIGADAG